MENPRTTKTIPMTWTRAFGMMLGSGLGSCFIGGFLCLTVIGAIVGIPMILAGIGLILGSPFGNKLTVKGECPYCSAELLVWKSKASIKCRTCKKRVLIKSGGAELTTIPV